MISDLIEMLTLAQAAPQPSGFDAFKGMMFPMLIILAIMYFMIMRPQQRKEKVRREMIKNLKTGTRVIFGGGILGTVANVKEGTFIVKVADNVKIEISRGAVSRALDKGERVDAEEDK